MRLRRDNSKIPARAQVIDWVIRNKGPLLIMIGVIVTWGFWSEFRGRQALAQPKEKLSNP